MSRKAFCEGVKCATASILAPADFEDEGRGGKVVRLTLTGEAGALERFASALHDGRRLAPE